MTREILAAALLGLSLALPAQAQQAGVTVTGAWSRATSASARAGGVFLSLHGAGAGDRVTGASSPVAERAELHETVADNGVMKMRPVEGVPVAPGQEVALKPGGLHIMLMGLTRPLNRGDHFPITLRFEKAAPVTVDVAVQGPGAAGPAMDHGGMGHGAMPHGAMPGAPTRP